MGLNYIFSQILLLSTLLISTWAISRFCLHCENHNVFASLWKWTSVLAMSFYNSLIKLQTHIGVLLFACSIPFLLMVALLAKILTKLIYCFCGSPKSIVGEVALVTGAGHGLGREIALKLAQKGCHIAVVDINLPGAESTVKQINDISTVRAKAYKVNVTQYEELVKLNEQINVDFGPVTILVNNAGILLHRNNMKPEASDIQQMIDVNLTSHFFTKLVFLPKMKELRKGYFVAVASVAGFIPLLYSSAYSATKSAVITHMRTLRLELTIEKQSNILITTVMPTFLQANKEVVSVVEQINIDRLYPLISAQTAASRIVEGMLRGENEIAMPGIIKLYCRSMSLLPISWQEKLLLIVSSKIFKDFSTLYSL